MKKTSQSFFGTFILLVSIFSTSCNKIKDAIAAKTDPISLTQANIIITLPVSSNTDQQIAYGETKFDLDSAIQKQSGVSTLTYAKYAKHINVTSLIGSIINGDAKNNFNNLTFSTSTSPAILFNTTNDYNTATTIGGNAQTTPLTDPYNWNIPVTGNTDLITHINGKTWDYLMGYKLSKPTTKDIQISLTVNYQILFQ